MSAPTATPDADSTERRFRRRVTRRTRRGSARAANHQPEPSPRRSREARVDFSDRSLRRRRRRRILVLVGLVLLSAAVVWLVWFSSVLSVREVRVLGVQDARASEVLAVAAVPVGVPLARLDTGAAEQRVRDLPWVASAEVRRGWPIEAVIAVTLREPIAVMESDPRRLAVDADGVVFEMDQALPGRLPRMRAEGAALEVAVAVLQSLPDDIRDRVVTVVATTRDDVDLLLRSGDEVRWGNASQAETKAEVLRALLSRKADMYDVSAPELPTTFRLS